MISPYFHTQLRLKRGFTLVELLVVIGIIAILAAVTIGGVSAAIRAAKRAKATSTCTQIATGVQNYYTEYGIYPVVPGTAMDDYYDGTTTGSGGPKWGNLTVALCGNIDPFTGKAATSTIPNTRGIQYLTPTRSDLDTVNHTFQNPFGSSQKGQYYFMVVDADYSGVVGDTGTAPYDFSGQYASAAGKAVPGGVAVWCSCDQPVPPTAKSLSSAYAKSY